MVKMWWKPKMYKFMFRIKIETPSSDREFKRVLVGTYTKEEAIEKMYKEYKHISKSYFRNSVSVLLLEMECMD